MGIGFDSALGATTSDNDGIVPRFINSLFQQIEARQRASSDYSAQVHVSFLELYNEDLVDLLSPRQQGLNVCIREDSQGNICWMGVREEQVTSPKELLGYVLCYNFFFVPRVGI